MRDTFDAARVAALIEDSETDSEQLLTRLQIDPNARSIVKQLLAWPIGDVRFWALEAAMRICSREEYVDALDKAVHDRDDDVSSEATGRLVDVAPDHVLPLARSLAARLNSKVPSLEKVFLLWTLSKIRAVDALPQIAQLRSREPDWTKLSRVCDVVSLYLQAGAKPILDSIRSHGDHVRMEELCTVAWHVLATPAAREALDVCAATAPDEECRAKCNEALRRWASEGGVPTVVDA
jgi:hypothetical protein